jgi:hypothetical protein
MVNVALREYFENTKGIGVLATADKAGKVNAAIFARPHVLEDGQLAFIMPHRLTHANLAENPLANYLFKEEGPGYRGKRLYLKKVREEQDTPLIQTLRRRKYSPDQETGLKPLFMVIFRIEEELPLVGAGIDENYEND